MLEYRGHLLNSLACDIAGVTVVTRMKCQHEILPEKGEVSTFKRLATFQKRDLSNSKTRASKDTDVHGEDVPGRVYLRVSINRDHSVGNKRRWRLDTKHQPG